ncbi:MAG: hypothetical protein WC709_09835 [Thermoleophilia bacterium]
MHFRRWQVQIAATLLVLAVLVYGLRWWLFSGQALHNEMLRYLVDDVAFLFIQVLLVSLLLDGLLQRRARESMLTKLNMIIGAFFSECGTELLGRLAVADTRLGEVRADLVASAAWEPRDYERAKHAFRDHRPLIDLAACDLVELRGRLGREKSYLLGLLGNQALLEHESFTDLLWAVTHVAEELAARRELSGLPPADAGHLAGDVQRAYTLLGVQWIDYLRHLQTQYPYLFSLAVRTNPLDPEASATVTS